MSSSIEGTSAHDDDDDAPVCARARRWWAIIARRDAVDARGGRIYVYTVYISTRARASSVAIVARRRSSDDSAARGVATDARVWGIVFFEVFGHTDRTEDIIILYSD